VLGKGRHGARTFSVSWPQSLGKLRYLKINVRLLSVCLHVPAGSLPKGNELTQIRKAGEIQINHALNELYRFLERENHLQVLNVKISSSPPDSSRYYEELFSPASAIASMITKSFINVDPYTSLLLPDLRESMQSAVDAFRDIRSLEQEVMLYTELQDGPLPKPSDSFSTHFSKPSFRSGSLALCEQLRSVRYSDSLYTFARYEELDGDMRFIKRL
jgi:hypothetical protein